ncbi:hypothetical protein GCM10010329_45750 [Streptomyces spiroverticillatus]|nr:hypothetical protein GCM10010329_45750 [Streptomyces spiroverticillatus]
MAAASTVSRGGAARRRRGAGVSGVEVSGRTAGSFFTRTFYPMRWRRWSRLREARVVAGVLESRTAELVASPYVGNRPTRYR